jgi:thiol reductant ABC exporter CydC subunit
MTGILLREWRRLVLAAVAGAAAAGAGIALVATAAWLISRAAQHPPVLALGAAIVGVRAFGLSKGLLRYGERLAGHDAALRVRTELRARLYERLVRLWPAGLRHDRPGQLLQQLNSDVDSAVGVLARALLPFASAALAGLVTAAWLAMLLPAAALALLAGLAVVLVAVPLLQHALARRAARRTAPLREEYAAATVELLHGLPDLIAFGAGPDRLTRLEGIDDRLRRSQARTATTTGLAAALVALASGGCMWLSLLLGGSAVRAGQLDPVLLAVVVLTPLAVFEAAAGLPAAAEQAASGWAALRRLDAVLRRPDPVPDPVVPAVPLPPYHLKAEGVSTRWHEDAPLAVSDVDLDLPVGRKVALVGPSGSGKSTVAALLVRLLDPARGRVSLGGVDLRQLTGDSVRDVVTLVDSDAHLFDTTIEGNLRIGGHDATPAQLWAALHAVRLGEWVKGLPDGLATPVGEGGAQVSGGERRRLALARALLRDTPILVLDEPTEHLPEETAEALIRGLFDANPDRSIVLITHRRYGLDRVHKIIDLSTVDGVESR